MGHKKKRSKSISSSSQASSQEQIFKYFSLASQESNSSLTSSESQDHKSSVRKLSKKDLKKLIKLEKQIQKEQKILKREKSVKKAKQKKQQVKKQIAPAEQERYMPIVQNNIQTPESKKLFITGIHQKYTYEEVEAELKIALKNIQGVTGLRVKRKQGCPTYCFIDFQSKQVSKIALQKQDILYDSLKKKKIFGERMAIYYSQDIKKQSNNNNNKGSLSKKHCFECKQIGHFARDCKNKLKDLKLEIEKQQSKQILKSDEQTERPVKIEEQVIQPKQSDKTENTLEQKGKVKRLVRDKSRSAWLTGQN